MIENCVLVEKHDDAGKCEEVLFRGINEEAVKIKKQRPIQTFCFSIENEDKEILGGVSGVAYYGCLYVDMLWVDGRLREKGWGTKLMQEAEAFGKNQECNFATVNTMDWEALSFYQKLGYTVEFVREGYTLDSKMYFLRKNL